LNGEPWLWSLFVTFIVACGLTHLAHVWSANGSDNLWALAAAEAFCALASVGTAIAFAFVLPEIKMLPSPHQQRAELENAVLQRTREKDRLLREVHHRVGNQVQILGSLLSIEARRTDSAETLDAIARIRSNWTRWGPSTAVVRRWTTSARLSRPKRTCPPRPPAITPATRPSPLRREPRRLERPAGHEVIVIRRTPDGV
jgi:hypothetical protein